jgi:CsoR family transcriptional regulator, copper-sensing transcriptional repressor
MKHETKSLALQRLKKIEGQVRGIARMVEEDRYCIDVINQMMAARAALKKVEDELLKAHVGHCVENAIASGDTDDQRRKIAELMDILGRTNR